MYEYEYTVVPATYLVSHIELYILRIPREPVSEGGQVQDAGDVEQHGEEQGGDQVMQHQAAPTPRRRAGRGSGSAAPGGTDP